MGAEFGYRLHIGPNGELAIECKPDNSVIVFSAYITSEMNYTEEVSSRVLDETIPRFLPYHYPVHSYVDLRLRSCGRVQFLNALPPHFTNPLASFTTEALLAELYDRMEQRRLALQLPALPSTTTVQ